MREPKKKKRCIGFIGCIGGAEQLLLAKVKNASDRTGIFVCYEFFSQYKSAPQSGVQVGRAEGPHIKMLPKGYLNHIICLVVHRIPVLYWEMVSCLQMKNTKNL